MEKGRQDLPKNPNLVVAKKAKKKGALNWLTLLGKWGNWQSKGGLNSPSQILGQLEEKAQKKPFGKLEWFKKGPSPG